MKILVVEPDLFDNGAIRVSLDRASRWATSGHRVTLFVVHPYEDGPPRVDPPPGIDVVFGTPRVRRPAVDVPLALLAGVTAARRADVVVAGREIGDGLVHAAAMSRLARRPMAVTVQSRIDAAFDNYVPPRQQAITRWALRSAERAVCVADGLTALVRDVGVAPERIRVVTNGIDVAAVRAASLREPEVPLDQGRPTIAASGRLDTQKGLDVLVRAHARALEDGAPDHEVVIMGTGPDRESLTDLARELSVADSVRLVGFVDNPHAVVSRADLFVLPSRWEGYPLALVEALVLGTPAIAADCVSGPREILQDTYGELVPVDDPDALAAAMARHLRRPEPLRARARSAAAAAEESYDSRRSAERHLAVLEELVRPSPSGPERAPLR